MLNYHTENYTISEINKKNRLLKEVIITHY